MSLIFKEWLRLNPLECRLDAAVCDFQLFLGSLGDV